MSVQYPIIPIATNPVGIDAVVIDLQGLLNSNLSWLSDGLGRAYKMNKVRSNGAAQILPLVYLGTSNYTYFSAQPDNDKQGQNFILVGDGVHINQQQGFYSILEYDISIIFSVNLKLINAPLLLTEDFTQNLIAQVRDVLLRQTLGKPYNIGQITETRLFGDVYSEFDILNDSPNTGKAMTEMSYFRFNFPIQIKEACPVPVLPPNVCYSMQFDAVNNYIEASGSTSFDFDINDPFSFTFWHKEYFGAFKPLATKIGGGKGYRFMKDTGGQLFVQLINSASTYIYVRTSLSLSGGGWNHYAITYNGNGDATGLNIYFNGVQQAITIVQNNFPALGTMITAQNFIIGAQLPTLFVGGNSALMRCWDIELSDINILAEYNFKLNGNIINPSNLVGSPNIKTSTFDGLDWTFPDIANNSVFKSVNMELGDRVEDCPT